MSSLTDNALAQKVWFDEYNMWVLLTDGRQLSVPLAYFPRLKNASGADRENFVISGGGYGLHWDDLDEDILVESLLYGQYHKEAV